MVAVLASQVGNKILAGGLSGIDNDFQSIQLWSVA